MDDEFISYAILFMALIPLAAWAKAWMNGTTTELFVTDETSAHRGDGIFEAAQRYRLLFAAACIAAGVYGLTVGFE